MTNFTEIYDIFLSQIDDPVFMERDEGDELKKRYLLNCIPRFNKCKQDLSDRIFIKEDINDETLEYGDFFIADLTEEEKLILGLLMVTEYLNPMIITLQNLKQFLSSKDFNLTSQANHLKQLSVMRKFKMDEANKLILDYTYNNGKLSGLR